MKRNYMLVLALALVAFAFPLTAFATSYDNITLTVNQDGSVIESLPMPQ